MSLNSTAGSASAESYASVAQATARHLALGNDTWATISNQLMEEALRRATVFMTQSYRSRWIGIRATSTQALEWPRYSACVDGYPIAVDIVPTDIINACCDLALKAAAGDLAPDLERAVKREKIGPIETEYETYSSQVTSYRSINMALAPYLKGSSGMATLVRT